VVISAQAPSDQALVRLAAAASLNGVDFVFGKNGHAVKLINDPKGNCGGVVTQSGAVHTADKVILACGAQTANLIDTKSELSAKAMCVGMIQLTEAEREKYKKLPMVDHFEMGKCR
jgi:sarcosine oxidase / L-pipecolate oxidase